MHPNEQVHQVMLLLTNAKPSRPLYQRMYVEISFSVYKEYKLCSLELSQCHFYEEFGHIFAKKKNYTFRLLLKQSLFSQMKEYRELISVIT